MRRLLFFVFLALIAVLLYAQPPPKWKQTLQELKQERLSIELQLKAIGDELQTTKDTLMSFEIKHGEMKSYYEALEKNLQSRIDSLEEQRSQLAEDKKQLSERIARLEESESSLSDLSGSWQKYKSEAEGQIRLWKGLAIGSGIVAAGTVTYLIIDAVKNAIKK